MRTQRFLPFQSLVVALALGASCGPPPLETSSQEPQPRLVDQTGHDESPGALDFSPDGRFVVTGSRDGRAVLWSVASGRVVQRFQVQRHDVPTPWVEDWQDETGVLAVAFSPDGELIATGGVDGFVRLWSVYGREIATLARHEGRVFAVVFSADGKQLLSGGADNVARLWSVDERAAIRTLEGHDELIMDVALSPDGRHALTASYDRTARLWSLADGTIRHTLYHPDILYSATFTPDGRHVLTAGNDPRVRVWSLDNGRETGGFDTDGIVRTVIVSPNGEDVVTAGKEGTALWEFPESDPVHVFPGFRWGTVAAAFSPTGTHLAVADTPLMEGASVRIWNFPERTLAHRLESDFETITSVSFASSGNVAVAGHYDGTLAAWALDSGKVSRRPTGHTEWIHHVSVTADGRYAFSNSEDCKKILWSLETGEPLWTFGECLYDAYVSPDGRSVLVVESRVGETGEIVLRAIDSDGVSLPIWSGRGVKAAYAPSGTEVLRLTDDDQLELLSFERVLNDGASSPTVVGTWQLPPERWDLPDPKRIQYLAITADTKYIVTGHGSSGVLIWNAETGDRLHRLTGNAEHPGSVSLSGDGRLILIADDSTARLWDVATGQEIKSFEHPGTFSVALSADGHFALSGGDSAVARLWSVDTGQLAATLLSGRADSWAVVAPDGRFDAQRLESVPGLHWIMPDDPFEPMPIEILMAEYYEPMLLARILAGEVLPELPSVATKNRAQPTLEITSIEPSADSPDRVDVTVVATPHVRIRPAGGAEQSGINDVRLFRDGQIVGYAPGNRDWELEPPSPTVEGELQRWRQATRVVADSSTDTSTFRFDGIFLPSRDSPRPVDFSAYAFNRDRVKSATTTRAFEALADAPLRRGRAYVIAVGVNAYESAAWDLAFAASDAREVLGAIPDRLRRTDRYERVVTVPLISERTPSGVELATNDATKNKFRAVIDLLAGRDVRPEVRNSLPGGDDIRRARPEDLVLITFSSHGYAGDRGTFYLFPYDIGAGRRKIVSRELLTRAISSSELSSWLRDVDAGDITMIVDACHSAASVEGSGFKPGPMGSRGLGQLAYDKGMRILAATQVDDVALESSRVSQGLLTYALLRDGLQARQADFRPADNRILLSEWLSYAVERVPRLHEELQRGSIQDFGLAESWRGVSLVDNDSLERGEPPLRQRPSLFDFARREDEAVLSLLDTEEDDSVRERQ